MTEPTTVPHAPGPPRVLLIGGSVAHGLGVRLSWGARAAEALAATEVLDPVGR